MKINCIVEGESGLRDGAMAVVVNVKVAHIRPQYNNLQEWMADPNNVYIGRAGIVFIAVGDAKERFPKKASIWANPFKVDKIEGRATAIEQYEKYIRAKLESGEIKVEQLMELEGKNLGCWCKPNACHGDVLVKLLHEYKNK